ncbi:MAG: hypothetical protein Kow0042_21450 [Calditrichia bacterium]
MNHHIDREDKSPDNLTRNRKAGFVAINFIHCEESYKGRFEELFASRAHAIDRMPGFLYMEVLRPVKEGDYLIISHWENEQSFLNWAGSPEFREGHKRGFQDIKEAVKRGEKPPLTSDFKTYTIVSR